MPVSIKIKILVENNVYRRELMAEHGLALWIKYGEEEYLFDTGQGMVLLHNAEKMGIDLKRLKGVFLSHGHYDHTGGLKSILDLSPELRVYAHPGVFVPKYYQETGYLRENGMKLTREAIPGFIPVTDLKEIGEGLWCCNQIECNNKFSAIDPGFKIKQGNELISDDFKDDQSLFLETRNGLVVLAGCSHVGIVNILQHIRKVTGNKHIHAVIGGMHLINASKEYIEQTIMYFKKLDFDLLVPLHCTGINAINEMVNNLGERVKIAFTGDEFNF
jgi:7,8-dihydropterin-6-yl-methyl-4-(beta-D-ribofuranosyl)aminobenzene 5'-phosphate synthase